MTGPLSLTDVKHSGTAELALPSQKPEKIAHRISKKSRVEANQESKANDIVIGQLEARCKSCLSPREILPLWL
jgi:hypothetical protein